MALEQQLIRFAKALRSWKNQTNQRLDALEQRPSIDNLPVADGTPPELFLVCQGGVWRTASFAQMKGWLKSSRQA